jgi:hypothetical protein
MEVGQGPNWGCSAKEKRILKLMERCTPVEYTHLPNAFSDILHTSFSLMLIYCRCKSNVAKPVTLTDILLHS